jgi:hypothetical protein
MAALVERKAKAVYEKAAKKLHDDPVDKYLRTLKGHEKLADALTGRTSETLSKAPKK